MVYQPRLLLQQLLQRQLKKGLGENFKIQTPTLGKASNFNLQLRRRRPEQSQFEFGAFELSLDFEFWILKFF
jgi:hypothetical protein